MTKYWVRPVEVGFGDVLWIFGLTESDESVIAKEIALGASEYEAAEVAKMLVRARLNGRMYGMAYSMACEGGEFGSTPIAETYELFEEEFALARECGWDMAALMATTVGQSMFARMTAELVVRLQAVQEVKSDDVG